jgi:hypothetical protein
MRYKPFGVMVDKEWLYAKGGRPVIYQTGAEFDMLPDEFKYRHVRYEPDINIDHTWEREWRIREEVLNLELDRTTFVVPTREWEMHFLEQHEAMLRRRGAAAFAGGLGPREVTRFPMHFIVLEDLGVDFDSVAPPPSPLSSR